MPSNDPQAIIDAELREFLKPLMRLQGPEAQTRMGKTVGEGLSLPKPDQVIAERVPPNQIKAAREQTVKWLRTIVRQRSLPEDLPGRLYGIRKATPEQDAFIAAWRAGGRTLEVVVTRERVHVLTGLDRPLGLTAANESELFKSCVTEANELFELPSPLKSSGWRVRRFGGLLLGTGEVSFARNWYETLLILTDGASVKYSVLKYKDLTSPLEKESPVEDVTPWFPPK
jgi:hypothetical protein